MTDLLTRPEAAEAADVSWRQVDYWSTIGLIAPAVNRGGSGNLRKYDEANVRDMRLVGLLSHAIGNSQGLAVLARQLLYLVHLVGDAESWTINVSPSVAITIRNPERTFTP